MGKNPVNPPMKRIVGRNFDIHILTDDLWENIFLQLPIRSLYRLKCVSKEWKNLISEAEAAGRLPKPGPGVFYFELNTGAFRYDSLLHDRRKIVGDLGLEFLPCFNSPSFKIEHTCNGLLLCSCCDHNLNFRRITIDYFVCNPLTKAWIHLPNRQAVFWHFNHFLSEPEVVLLSDPHEITHFKVIRLLQHSISAGGRLKVDMYSSETGKWDVFIAQGDVPPMFLFHLRPAYLKGVLYTLVVNQSDKCVLGLDVIARKLFLILLPTAIEHHRCIVDMFLKEFNGDLHFVGNVLSEILVWKLEDQCTGTWVLRRRISIQDLAKQHPLCNELSWSFLPTAMRDDFDVLYLVGAHQEAKVVILEKVYDLLKKGAKFFSYHLKSHRLEKFRDMRDDLQLNYICSSSSTKYFFPLTTCPVKFFKTQQGHRVVVLK